MLNYMKLNSATKLFFFTAIFSLIYSVLTKLFMYNKDILRQKNSDFQFTPSQVYIGIAVAFFLMALVYYLFDRSSRFYIKRKLQLLHYFLVTPLILVLYTANFLQSFFPQASSNNSADWLFVTLALVSTLAFISGVILFFVNIVIGFSTRKNYEQIHS